MKCALVIRFVSKIVICCVLTPVEMWTRFNRNQALCYLPRIRSAALFGLQFSLLLLKGIPCKKKHSPPKFALLVLCDHFV